MDTDEDLLAYMAMRGEDPDGAQAAWRTYFKRHIEFICRILKGRLARHVTEATIDDIAQETMRRAFERADTYSPAISESRAPRSPETASRPWLVGIASNLVKDALSHPELSNSEERLSAEPRSCANVSVADERLADVSRAIDELDEREREIVTLTLSEFPNRLRPGQAEALADRLGTTPANLRQMRSRAYAKLRIKLRKFDLPVVREEQRNDEEA